MELLTWVESLGVSVWVREAPTLLALPTILTLHTFGLMVLVGASWTLDLRLLGLGRSIPLEPMRALFAVMWGGFAVNAATGLLLFAADATNRGTSILFLFKMALVAAGVVVLRAIQRDVFGDNRDPVRVSGRARALAATSILVWIAVITAGRLLAYV